MRRCLLSFFFGKAVALVAAMLESRARRRTRETRSVARAYPGYQPL